MVVVVVVVVGHGGGGGGGGGGGDDGGCGDGGGGRGEGGGGQLLAEITTREVISFFALLKLKKIGSNKIEDCLKNENEIFFEETKAYAIRQSKRERTHTTTVSSSKG